MTCGCSLPWLEVAHGAATGPECLTRGECCRPAWMNARAALSSSASPQLKPSQLPLLAGSIPVGGTALVAGAAGHPQEAADSAAQPLMHAAPAEPPAVNPAAPSMASSGTELTDAALQQGGLSSGISLPQGGIAAASSMGQQHEQVLSSASPVRVEERPGAILHASPAGAKHRNAVQAMMSGSAEEDDADASWDALLARPSPAQAPKQPNQEQAASLAPSMQQAVQESAGAAHLEAAAQPASTSNDAAAGYASLSDAYASSQQLHTAERSRQAAPSASHAQLSDAHASSKQASPERPLPRSSPAADYAHLSDEYLGGISSGAALSGPPPRAEVLAGRPDSLISGGATSSNSYAALSDSYLSPPDLEPRISGALPVSSNAAMGPPSHSALDPIEQRQLGAPPASVATAVLAPPQPARDALVQASDSFSVPELPSKGSADGSVRAARPLWGGSAGQLDTVQSASAAPASSLFGSFGIDSRAGSGRVSPLRPWHEPMLNPPPSSFQQPPWSTSDSNQASVSRLEQSALDSSVPGLQEAPNGTSRPSELSNGHAAGLNSSLSIFPSSYSMPIIRYASILRQASVLFVVVVTSQEPLLV